MGLGLDNRKNINIPISESDLEKFKALSYNEDEESFTWLFPTGNGEWIDLTFMTTKEYEEWEAEDAEPLSECCGATIIMGDLCSDCKEHT